MEKKENMIVYGKSARVALKQGIDIVADAVKVTLGAQGRNVLISNDRGASPHVTKDGVTVAKSIQVKDALHRQGALLIKEVAETTNTAVGDGTTTSTVLAQKISNDGLKLLDDSNLNVMSLRKGMDYAREMVSQLISQHALPVENKEDITDIATISANNDKYIGKLIGDAYEKIGKHGVISVDASESSETYIEYVDGYQFDRGLTTPYFITDTHKMRSVLTNPYILVTDYILNRAEDFAALMNSIQKKNRSVVIICEDMEFGCTQDFLRNHISGFLKVAVVKAPEFGDRRYDMLQDICTITGANFISKERGDDISKVTIEDLGEADSMIMDMDTTTIVGGQGSSELISARIEEIMALKEGKKGYELEVFEKRLGKMTGGAAVIRVGARSEVDLRELKDRIEDALSAVKASIEGGVLIGGGAFLYRVSQRVYKAGEIDASRSESFIKGYNLVLDSLAEPIKTILTNGETMDSLVALDNTISKGNTTTGVNVITGEVVDMFKEGILDPANVVRSTVDNAVSVASTLLLTEVIVLGDDYSKDKPHDLFS